MKTRLTCPAAVLVVGLGVAVGLMLVPVDRLGTAKGYVGAVLRPGQVVVLSLRERCGQIVARARSHFATGARLAEIEQERNRLARENRRLGAELAVLRGQVSDPAPRSDDDGLDRLLRAQWVRARVLGQQARAFLGRRHLLDVGSRSGVQPNAPVVDAPRGLIDQGRDAELSSGQLVLIGARVWGKVVEVGPYTSTVRTVSEPGYRDLVRLRRSGPQGILEGTGEPLARVRLIEVTEPVAVGDLVYSAAEKGVVLEPLLYGRVVRVQRPVGAAHWEIWMQPSVDPDEAEQVAVLLVELNPVRVAGNGELGVGSGEW